MVENQKQKTTSYSNSNLDSNFWDAKRASWNAQMIRTTKLQTCVLLQNQRSWKYLHSKILWYWLIVFIFLLHVFFLFGKNILFYESGVCYILDWKVRCCARRRRPFNSQYFVEGRTGRYYLTCVLGTALWI